MGDKIKSEFASMYKSGMMTIAERQAQRRLDLLDKQKKERNKNIDAARSFDEIVNSLNDLNSNQRQPKYYENYVQLSEWLREKPTDFDKWLMVPCPKGMRCIVVAREHSTKIYNKKGFFVRNFRSKLPGDVRNKNSTTILDCIYDKTNDTLYALDVIAYGDQEMEQCDSSFRFFWLQSKIDEENLSDTDKQNEISILPLQHIDCSDEISLKECLSLYPMWLGNRPELDGLLFYHKDAFYIHGTTPLVGWLLPFMLPEILHESFELHPAYIKLKPENYTNATAFMNEFDKNIETRRKMKNKKYIDRMEAQEIKNIVFDEERLLEMDGHCEDDVYFEKMN